MGQVTGILPPLASIELSLGGEGQSNGRTLQLEEVTAGDDEGNL